MKFIDFGEFKLAIDPENNFWVICDDEMPEEVMRIYSEIKDELDERMKRYRFEIDIRTVYLYVNEICNANCPYCFIPGEIRSSGRELSRDQLDGMLQKFAEMGIENVIFHGVEPLMSKEIVFDCIENHDFDFGLLTNGFLLEEDDAEFLIEEGVNVSVSFDSPYEEVEDFLRGRGQFRKVCEILEWFDGYGRFSTITTITGYNYDHLPELIDFLAGRVRVALVNPVRGTSAGGRALRPPTTAAAEKFIDAVEKAIWHTKNGRRIVIADFANILLGIVAPYSRILQCDISPCGAGRRFIAVTPRGTYPCAEFVGFEEFRMDSLHSIVTQRRVELIEDCKGCAYRNICGSPCPAEVYAETGSLFEKSPFCEFYRRVIEHAFRVLWRGDIGSVLRLERLRKLYEIKIK